MIILGIETSCDETALCLIEFKGENIDNGEYKVLANIVNSQIDIHKEYGGVFPMLAKREHTRNLPIIYKQILTESDIDENKIDKIAVTTGPGLAPALWTGIVFAKELKEKLNIPIVPINHMEGHILSTIIPNTDKSDNFNKFNKIEFPALAVLISGGHTEIVLIKNIGEYQILGHTVDDAVGEAFDKVARMLNLPYPGGPQISKYAEMARLENFQSEFELPRPMIHSKDFNFSFSGLKTSVLYKLKEYTDKGIEINDRIIKNISLEFENSVTEVLIKKTNRAIDQNEIKSIIVGGGVIANKYIRNEFIKLSNSKNIRLHLPEKDITGDNALMIAISAFLNTKIPSNEDIIALGNLSLS